MLRNTMMGLILATSIASFVAGCGLSATKGSERGQEVFRTCKPCHGDHGAGSLDLRAPAIAGLPEWYVAAELTKFKNDYRGAHPDDNEGHRMRPMARTLYHPGDLEAVATYVSKLPPVWIPPTGPGDAAEGAKRYTTLCIACHGADGKGQQGMNAPPLTTQADWYLVAQLKKFKVGMRGEDPHDGTGAQMRAMGSTLPDTLAMHDVVAYIKSMPH